MRLRRVRASSGEPAPDVRFRWPSRRELRALLVYVGAAVVYIVIGVFTTDFLFSVFVAAAYLLVAAWLVPAGIRRLR